MKRASVPKLIGCLAVASCVVAAAPVLGADPVCTRMKAALQALRTTPMHIYMTQTQLFNNPAMGKAAAQIGMGGSKQSEEISTGKDIYVLTNGRWIDMQTSFAAMEDDKDSDPDTRKAMDESTCKVLADDSTLGEPTSVYLQSIPSLGTETKVWISKVTNRPVRSETTHDSGAMKIVSVSRYEYAGVQAPSQSVTMKDMVKSSRSK